MTLVTELFTGQERDAESGLDHFPARFYSGASGRFTSADPLGNFVADPGSPQSWNMYSYVLNNPLKFIDPTGMACTYQGADNGGASDYADPTNYIDDNNGGQSCAQAFASPPQQVDVTDNNSWLNNLSFSSQWGGGSNQGTSGNPPSQTGRGWLNNITSVFGYDRNDPRPSCFGGFLADTGSAYVPTDMPAPGDAVSSSAELLSRLRFGQAVAHASTTASKTFGTRFLLYPNKSTIFRSLIKSSGFWSKVSFWGGLVTAETSAFFNEYQKVQAGQCQ